MSRRFATMSDEERRRYELEQERTAEATPQLDFDEPRREHERTKADLEDKDGTAALLDEEAHARRVRENAGRTRERRDRA